MDAQCRDLIKKEILSCVERTIERTGNASSHRPFHEAIFSEEALFWSQFERSFSTSFGQRVIERITCAAALSNGASEAKTQKETAALLSNAQIEAINRHISSLREGGAGRLPPDWERDLASLRNADAENPTLNRVISDLWWRKDGVDHYMSIKTVKPNIDQSAEAKRDLLKLKLYAPNCRVYFGLYYNPYGECKADYAWAPPKGIFNFLEDSVVLIGSEYWDTVGGNGFYGELLNIAQECGETTQKLIGNLFIK